MYDAICEIRPITAENAETALCGEIALFPREPGVQQSRCRPCHFPLSVLHAECRNSLMKFRLRKSLHLAYMSCNDATTLRKPLIQSSRLRFGPANATNPLRTFAFDQFVCQ